MAALWTLTLTGPNCCWFPLTGATSRMLPMTYPLTVEQSEQMKASLSMKDVKAGNAATTALETNSLR